MSEERVRFPEYGQGGDYVGARRARRAFRFFVAAVVIFTLMLAYAELYLQQEGAERLYTHALTLQDESARVLLKQAVLHDKQTQEVPTPKYLEALAPREETAKVLSTYEEAFNLDETNPVLALRYGCELLRAGRTEEAAAKFTVAATADRSNALPLYLKAVAQPGGYTSPEGLSESIALIAQANTSGKSVSFPRPLWSSMLPVRGRVYAELCRHIVDECSAPLYGYLNAVIGQAKADIPAGRTQYWDAWLQTLEAMGDRILLSAAGAGNESEGPAAGGALQALLGIHIQLAALDQRLAIIQMRGAPPNAALAARKAKLEAALEPLLAFENGRRERIDRDRSGYLFPGKLFLLAFLGAFVAYLVSRLAWNRWGRRIAVHPSLETDETNAKGALAEPGTDPELTIRHTPVAKIVLVAGAALLLVTLFVVQALQQSRTNEQAWMPILSVVWNLELLALLAFGLLYPALTLPGAPTVGANHAGSLEQREELLRLARLHRRRAASCLTYRYYGILLGLVLTVFAVWTVEYRMASELYPWQTPILTTGLIRDEAAVVQSTLQRLN